MITVSDYGRMCQADNLRRAYRWLQSNPDVRFKSFFRDSYTAYAASSDQNLTRLRKHLIRGAYEANHASKIYLPKSSGILRPYTLLSVEDQIVYQTAVNVIGEKLAPIIKKRYFKNIFGHIYAGKSSQFFYIQWQKGYHAYSQALVKHVNDGYSYVANFDLTSFYDTIDHAVLEYFLKDIQVDRELLEFLLLCLKTWTSSTWTNLSNAIYHGHGIPQGPLSSGLLSEVILRHIDEKGTRRDRTTKYLRYVDDIKILSKKEISLKQKLIALDLAAKEIGLFPQSSKINIRKVRNPYEEVKSVSRAGSLISLPAKNQKGLRKQILEVCKRGIVNNENQTRFKYLLSRAMPHHTLNMHLIKVMKGQPTLSAGICAYFCKYKHLPRKSADGMIQCLINEVAYHSVQANILLAILDNMSDSHNSLILSYCTERLLKKRKGYLPPQPSLKAALLAWLLRKNRLTYTEMHKFLTEETDWWVVKDVIKYIQKDHYGFASYEAIMNELIKGPSSEQSRIAALKIVDERLSLRVPFKEVHEAARLLLYSAGKIRHIGKVESLVGKVLCYVLDDTLPTFGWARLFGAKHSNAEHIVFTIKRDYESNINACIVTLDSFCDLLFETLFNKYLPGLQYGKYGAMLKHPTMQILLPKACCAFTILHKLRLQSITTHPRDEKTGTSTRRLKHHDLYKVRPCLREAFREITAIV